MNRLSFPSRTLVSQQDSARIETARIPRATFLNRWSRKTTFDAGYLIPFLIQEILPGDHVRYNVTAYVRMSTPLFPLFDDQRIDTHFFYVPNRLVWDNWEKLMGAQDDPDDSIDYTVPQVEGSGPENVGSLVDHMGLPWVDGLVDPATQWHVNALPFRANNLIYNTWFRDENLVNTVPVPRDDGPDVPADFPLFKRAKSHDYFTSALPWAQKFDAPTIPLAGQAPIIGIGSLNRQPGTYIAQDVWETNQPAVTNYPQAKSFSDTVNDDKVAMRMAETSSGSGVYTPQVFANLAASTGIDINTFRVAYMVQTLNERAARGGTRYVEILKEQFGVSSPDFRLQRPEYIGGGQSPLNITPIAQTAPTEDAPLGALGGAGTATGQHHASYAATEHGYIIGYISVKTELSYQQGVHRLWSRQTRLEFYTPALAGLGEQAVTRGEIYAKGSAGGSNDTTVFGYMPRWDEYRQEYSQVTGMFRSNVAGTLDAWHLAQYFASAPVLGQTFILDSPPMDRVLAAGGLADDQQYLADIMIQRQITRALPTYGTPATLGRF